MGSLWSRSLKGFVSGGIVAFLAVWQLSTFTVVSPLLAQTATAERSSSLNDESDDDSDPLVVVVSTSKVDQLVPHISYLMRAVDQAQLSGIVNMMVNNYAQGMDRSKPIGLAISFSSSGEPTPVILLPVVNTEDFFKSLEQFGEPDELSDGLYSIEIGPSPYYAKEGNGWLYVSNDEQAATNFDADCDELLKPIAGAYDIGARFDLDQMPQELVDSLVAQMRGAFEMAMQQSEMQMRQAVEQAGTDEQKEVAQKQLEKFLTAKETQGKQFETLEEAITEIDEFTVGLLADADNKQVFLEWGMSFKEGSDLSKQIASTAAAKSGLTGIKLANEVVSFRAVDEILQIDDAIASTEMAFEQIDALIESEKDVKDWVKELVNNFKEVAIETIKEGKSDSALQVTVDPDLSIVFAGRIADGNRFADVLKSAYEDAKSEPSRPTITFDKAKHKDVTIHTGSVPLPADAAVEAKKVFGSSVTFALGTAAKTVYVSVGPQAEKNLIAAIDRVAKVTTPMKSSPLEFNVKLLPILQYIETIKADPIVEEMIQGAQQVPGKDNVHIGAKVVKNGVVARLNVEEGILKSIGYGIKASQGGPVNRSRPKK